jgi:hypothetical protein
MESLQSFRLTISSDTPTIGDDEWCHSVRSALPSLHTLEISPNGNGKTIINHRIPLLLSPSLSSLSVKGGRVWKLRSLSIIGCQITFLK